MNKYSFVALFLIAIINQPTLAKGLYTISITSTDITPTPPPYKHGYTSISNLLDATNQTNIPLSGYNQNSQATMGIELGNTTALLEYASNSPNLVFKMAGCNVDKTFTGTTTSAGLTSNSRTINENLFRDYIDSPNVRRKIEACIRGENVSQDILNLISNDDFFNTHTQNGQEQENYGLGLDIGRYTIGSQVHNIITLPLSYTHHYKEPGRRLKLSAPISFIDINGSKTYKVNFGATYNKPMNKNWTVAPTVHLGITASRDMGTSTTVLSAAVTNRYEFPYARNHVTLANTVGALTSLGMKIGDLKSYGSFNNQLIKNGISIEMPQSYHMLGGKTSTQLSVANTQYFGDKLYVDNYTDFAFSMGTRRKLGGVDNSQDSLQLGVTYTIGNRGYKGGKLNFGYEF